MPDLEFNPFNTSPGGVANATASFPPQDEVLLEKPPYPAETVQRPKRGRRPRQPLEASEAIGQEAKRPGRPKLTDEQKAANRAKRQSDRHAVGDDLPSLDIASVIAAVSGLHPTHAKFVGQAAAAMQAFPVEARIAVLNSLRQLFPHGTSA